MSTARKKSNKKQPPKFWREHDVVIVQPCFRIRKLSNGEGTQELYKTGKGIAYQKKKTKSTRRSFLCSSHKVQRWGRGQEEKSRQNSLQDEWWYEKRKSSCTKMLVDQCSGAELSIPLLKKGDTKREKNERKWMKKMGFLKICVFFFQLSPNVPSTNYVLFYKTVSVK